MNRGKRFKLLCYALIAVLAVVAVTTSFVGASNTEYTTMEVVVHEGDTLWSIAQKHGVDNWYKWKYETVRANDLANGGDIFEGQRILIEVAKP